MTSKDTLIHLFLMFCIGVLVLSFFFLFGEIKKVKETKIVTQGDTQTVVQQVDLKSVKDYVTEVVTSILKSQTPTPAPLPTSTSRPAQAKRITYLNLNGTITTQNTDWTDIGGTDTPINLATEYGKDAYVDWDASIKTSSSGSKVFVRLYDETHNIAVNGSDLESNSTTSVRVSSGRLYLWQGQNTYRVQIKSLNGVDASFDGGRIKIVY